jgi:mono/diheme cytochrome c family protein
MTVLLCACDYKPRNQGRVLYERNCQSCHMESGQGLGKLIPPVANADFVVDNKDELACMIRRGIQGEITVNGIVYDGVMEGNLQLSDVEINNLVHYILVDLNEQTSHFEIAEVRRQLEACAASE